MPAAARLGSQPWTRRAAESPTDICQVEVRRAQLRRTFGKIGKLRRNHLQQRHQFHASHAGKLGLRQYSHGFSSSF